MLVQGYVVRSRCSSCWHLATASRFTAVETSTASAAAAAAAAAAALSTNLRYDRCVQVGYHSHRTAVTVGSGCAAEKVAPCFVIFLTTASNFYCTSMYFKRLCGCPNRPHHGSCPSVCPSVRPRVCPSVPYGLLTHEKKDAEKPTLL